MNRRDFLKLSAVTSTFLIAGCGSKSSAGNSSIVSQNLPIPTLLRGVEKNGVKYFDISINETTHKFFKGVETATYAYGNSTYLGPTIYVENGDEVSINYTNNLKEKTTVHGHGMHVPAAMDGGPHQIINPGETWSARYQVKQKASTNWYHPHLMGKTAEHVYMGLAGLIIVNDSDAKALDLPSEYGVDDIPLVLQDRVFTNNQIDYSPSMHQIMRGYIGDYNLVNGAIEPTFDAVNKEVRFRILNGSNSSVYNLTFSDGRSFKLIATDNALVENVVTLNSILLSPGERAEIVVDFSNDLGKKITLKDTNNGKTFLNIDVNKSTSKVTSTPNSLVSLTHLNQSNAVKTRKFVLNGRMGNFQINGKSMNLNRIDEQVPLNNIEIWEVQNQMMMSHNFHIHATHFEIIERNGSSSNIKSYEKGYKDTVYLAPGDKVKIIVKMTDYSDSQNPYMYHCHFLEHEDREMMGQFVVI